MKTFVWYIEVNSSGNLLIQTSEYFSIRLTCSSFLHSHQYISHTIYLFPPVRSSWNNNQQKCSVAIITSIFNHYHYQNLNPFRADFIWVCLQKCNFYLEIFLLLSLHFPPLFVSLDLFIIWFTSSELITDLWSFLLHCA